jgi:type IV pilus assembly protein PilM
MVEAQLQAVTDAGLRPVMVDLTAFAVLRSLADNDDLGMGSTMEALIDVGARVTNIVVHEGGVPRFVRRVRG